MGIVTEVVCLAFQTADRKKSEEAWCVLLLRREKKRERIEKVRVFMWFCANDISIARGLKSFRHTCFAGSHVGRQTASVKRYVNFYEGEDIDMTSQPEECKEGKRIWEQ